MKWIRALRLRTLPLALSSVLTGAAIVGDRKAQFTLLLILTVVTTILLQILSNLANDYGDSKHGTDNENRVGPQRSVQSGAISLASMKKAVVLTSVLALVSGLSLLYLALPDASQRYTALGFLGLGLLAIAAAINYTAGNKPYGYRGLGDLAVLLFFGFTGVLGTAYLLGGAFSLSLLLPAAGIGLLSTAVLNLNNMRDISNDEKSGKKTLAVILGTKNAKGYHYTLFVIAWISLISWVTLFQDEKYFFAILVVVPIHIGHLLYVRKNKVPAELDPELKKVALSTFLISVIFLFASSF